MGANGNKLEYKYIKGYIESFGHILLSGSYVNSKTKLDIQCDNGHSYSMIWNSFFSNNRRCPKCANDTRASKQMHSFEYVKEYIESFENTLLSTRYSGAMSKLRIACPNGHIYFVTWNCFSSLGSRCPMCKISKGEERIRIVLREFRLLSDEQVRFDDCKDKRYLPFDFYLPEFNVCIEYQGKQHYEPVEHFGGKKQLKVQKKHDRIKRRFCKRTGIHLLEIPYWDFDNIEEIFIEELNL